MNKQVVKQVDKALRSADHIACHGRTASTMTVKETNAANAAAKRKQQGSK